MASIEIDGKRYEVPEGESLLAACLSLGLDLPYFCWHPAMGSVGACRQCAVVQFQSPEDARGRLVMACMTPVTDGLRIGFQSPMARQFRDEIIELLMTNHPHDCPVCEEGGECHLQDMTVMTGHTFRRYRGKKRTHRNQYLGPFINHEMNRCIACYRCVRFYQNYAGGSDLQAFGVHNNVYFGRHEDGVLENEFSGNLVEVCPTGVFTDKTFSDHYTRKWDLQTAPSVCIHCGLGCNITPGERYGEVRRVVNRYNGDVNGYFLCDRGRFGYGFVNSPNRTREPLLTGRAKIAPAAAEKHFASLLKFPRQVIGIGSPRASLEANFALRTLVGEDSFFLGVSDTEHALLTSILEILTQGGIRTPSMRETEHADAILILGEDLTNSAPRLALAVRQAVRNASFEMAKGLRIPVWQDDAVREVAQNVKSPLYIAAPRATRLDDIAAATYRGAAENIARLGFAVAHCLDEMAPAVSNLDAADARFAKAIAASLRLAENPLVIAGCSSQNPALVHAAFNVAKGLPAGKARLALVTPECNSLGLAMLGGQRLSEAFERVQQETADTVVVLENDLYRRAPKEHVDRFLQTADHVIVIDSLMHDTAEMAELVLPAAPFTETEGTLVSSEGRAQRYFPVMPPAGNARGSWQWLIQAIPDCQWQHLDALTEACANSTVLLEPIPRAAPDAEFRISGTKIPRQPHRYSGRTAMLANVHVAENRQPDDPESPFAFSMEGASAHVPPAFLPNVWSPGWDSNQAVSKFQDTTGGHVRGGDGGVRLIEAKGEKPWCGAPPEPFEPVRDQWRIVALPQIFGGDEASSHAAPIAERAPDPHVVLNPEDAKALGVTEGTPILLQGASEEIKACLPASLDETLPRGLIGVPLGIPESASLCGIGMVSLRKSSTSANPEAQL